MQRISFWKRALLVFLVGVQLETPEVSRAESRRPGKSLSPSRDHTLDTDSTYRIDVSGRLTEPLTTNLYDPLTIARLKRMQEMVAPQINIDDVDVEQTRSITEDALAIQSGRSAVRLIERSELQPLYRSIKDEFSAIQDALRFGVQQTPNGVSFTRKRKGRRLVELQVQFDPKTVLEPQLKIGDAVRFRYDFDQGEAIMEFQCAF
jgi:hypothetical protein